MSRHIGRAAVTARRPRPRPRPRPLPEPPIAAQDRSDPPTFLEVAAELGWCEAASRVNRWAAAGYEGDWRDAEYDNPSPVEAEAGDAA